MHFYIFVSSSLQNMARGHLFTHESLDNLHEDFAVQLNDTHPSIAVPELMQLLIDDHPYDWDKALEITRSTLCYTNHTLLPEAMEKCKVSLLQSPLTRLITDAIGEKWITNLNELRELEGLADDSVFQEAWNGVKEKKRGLCCHHRFPPP